MIALLFLIGFLCGCATTPPHCDTIEQLEATLKPGDIKGLEWFFSNQVQYWRDYKEADYRPSNATIKKGYGDCDDFAVIASEVVNSWHDNGWSATIVEGLGPKGKPHAWVNVFRAGKIKGRFDNGEFIKIK